MKQEDELDKRLRIYFDSYEKRNIKCESGVIVGSQVWRHKSACNCDKCMDCFNSIPKS